MNNKIAAKKSKKITLDEKCRLNFPPAIAEREKLVDQQRVYFVKSYRNCVIVDFHKIPDGVSQVFTGKITVSIIKGAVRIRFRHRVTVPAGIRDRCTFLRQRKVKIVDCGKYIELWPLPEKK